MRILLVEDQEVGARLITAALVGLGHEVEHLFSANEALERVEQEEFRIVISDWRMPGMDGIDLCRAIRQRTSTYIYFLLVTAQPVSLDAQRIAYGGGVDDFLRKPVNPHELSMRLHVAHRILSMTDELFRLKGFVPTCRSCRTPRRDPEFWHEVEVLVHRHRREGESLDVCPDCQPVMR